VGLGYVALILTRVTTTNCRRLLPPTYADLPAGGGNLTDVERAAREQTLGDRIGDRMRSRLAEMCVRVEMTGEDYRQSVKRASFRRKAAFPAFTLTYAAPALGAADLTGAWISFRYGSSLQNTQRLTSTCRMAATVTAW